MADLIKKIKIKKQDGTFTDYIPIGAEAQNVSTSDGDSVQLKLNKKPYYYNSVADMKADTKLKAGDMAATLGYYEINDGGGATYKITDEKSETDYQEELGNGLYATLIIEDDVNVKQFGAYGDGIHDDTIFIQKMLLYCNKLHFSDGSYCISETINFLDKIYCKFDNNSSIKYIGNEIINTLFNIIHNGNIASNYIRDNYIIGGIIDCNNKVENAIKIGGMHNIIIQPSHLKNYTNSAIYIDKTLGGNVAGGIMMSNCLCTSEESNYGIYDSGNDDCFTNIIVQNAKTGIYSESGRFVGVHCWIGKTSLIPNSLFAFIGGRICNFIGCFMDTYQKGFDGNNNTSVMISNLKIFDLPSFYTNEIYQNYPHTILFNRTGMEYLISGLYFATSHNFNFANDNNYNIRSKFENITIHNETGLVTVSNWCNQGDILYETTQLITGTKTSTTIGEVYKTETVDISKNGYDIIGVSIYNPQYLSKNMYFVTFLGTNAKVNVMSIATDGTEYGFQLRIIYKKQKYY